VRERELQPRALAAEQRAVGEHRNALYARGIEHALDVETESVGNDRYLDPTFATPGHERREGLVDVEAREGVGDKLVTRATEERHLTLRALPRADLAVRELEVDILPLGCAVRREQLLGNVLVDDGAVEVAKDGAWEHCAQPTG
jgi:hypothetical protein